MQGIPGINHSSQVRILFVEDSPNDMELALMEFQKARIDCVFLRIMTGEEIRESLKVFRPDIVICDYTLPQINGREALGIILEQNPLLPVIMFTGTQNETVAVECMKAGAVDYILKDNITRLPYAVREALESKKHRVLNEKAKQEEKKYIARLEQLNSELIEARDAALNILEDLNQEIKERVQAEHAIRKSEAQLANAIKMARLGPWELDVVSGIFSFTDSFFAIFHTTKEEVGGYRMSIADYADRFVHPDDASMVAEETHKAIETDDPNFSRYLEHRIIYADGGVGQIAVRFFIVKDNQGKTIKTYGINQDITERRNFEMRLMESEEKFRTLYLNSPLPYQSLDENGTIKDVNPAWLSTLGCSRQEVIGRRFSEFLHPDVIAHFEKNFPEFKRRGYVHGVQFKLRHRDGHYLDVEYEGQIGFDSDGSFKQTYCVFQDITKRILAETQYAHLFNRMNEGFALHEILLNKKGIPVNYRYLEVNPAFEILTGLKASDVIGKTVLEVIPGIEKSWIKRYGDVAMTGVPDHFIQYSKSLGKWYSVSAFSPSNSRVASVFLDVTEQLETQDALRVSENKFRGIAEQVTDVIYITDKQGVIRYISPATRRHFGYEPEEMTGVHFKTFLADSEIPRAVKKFKASLRTGKVERELILTMKRNNGTVFTGELQAAPYLEGNRITGSLGIIRDITDRIRTEEALRESATRLQELSSHIQEVREQERREIAMNLHDDLGQKLTALNIDLTWVIKRFQPDWIEGRERLIRMQNLLNDSMTLVREISSDLHPSILENLGMVAAIRWQANEFSERTGIGCMVSTSTEDILIPPGKAIHLFRIVQEALTNIMRHAEATHVTITMEEDARNWQIRIRDDGKGFHELHPSQRHTFGLTGMNERARLCGGTFRIKGILGKGTTVHIRIPVS